MNKARIGEGLLGSINILKFRPFWHLDRERKTSVVSSLSAIYELILETMEGRR
jgi:hypothetical protein